MEDEIKQLPDPPRGLTEAALRGRIVPFVGAGASMLAGCPNWSDFADAALHFFIRHGKLTHSQLDQIRPLHPRIKLTLAKSLEEQHTLPINFRAILYGNTRALELEENGRRLYGALAKMAKTFVTTNYDEWLDSDAPPELTPSTAETEVEANSITTARRPIYKVQEFVPDSLAPGNVIHLHGSLADQGAMVLTTRDYVEHYRNDRFQSGDGENLVLTFLEHLFGNRTVLFIGYGLEELELLEHVIVKARQQQQRSQEREVRHYLLQGFYSHELELMKALRAYYAECGIELISFSRDEKNWQQLIDVIEKFASSMPAADAMKADRLNEMEGLLGG